jgi:serpin B
MLLNGANSTTESSMSYAMRTSNLTMDQINATYKDLIDELTTVDEKVLLAIANSIWYRNGFLLKMISWILMKYTITPKLLLLISAHHRQLIS